MPFTRGSNWSLGEAWDSARGRGQSASCRQAALRLQLSFRTPPYLPREDPAFLEWRTAAASTTSPRSVDGPIHPVRGSQSAGLNASNSASRLSCTCARCIPPRPNGHLSPHEEPPLAQPDTSPWRTNSWRRQPHRRCNTSLLTFFSLLRRLINYAAILRRWARCGTAFPFPIYSASSRR